MSSKTVNNEAPADYILFGNVLGINPLKYSDIFSIESRFI